MEVIAFFKDYKVIRKTLDYLRIYEFRKDRPPPNSFAIADSFGYYPKNDHIDGSCLAWVYYKI